MLGPFIFTFTFTLESEEFEKFEKVAAAGYVIDHELTLELLTELINAFIQSCQNKILNLTTKLLFSRNLRSKTVNYWTDNHFSDRRDSYLMRAIAC